MHPAHTLRYKHALTFRHDGVYNEQIQIQNGLKHLKGLPGWGVELKASTAGQNSVTPCEEDPRGVFRTLTMSTVPISCNYE
ncbi:hypothetical protein NDU88_006734 [Pleurodeles waltl]|uniref:Uncharacterized protein n=1 Tax=Pleurodeles waltl TaxID=8319 RepID=A0AAV7ULV2_PLEWA|nr:hypothetical protein NDU88_006734 [Pleurodeles waltl]